MDNQQIREEDIESAITLMVYYSFYTALIRSSISTSETFEEQFAEMFNRYHNALHNASIERIQLFNEVMVAGIAHQQEIIERTILAAVQRRNAEERVFNNGGQESDGTEDLTDTEDEAQND